MFLLVATCFAPRAQKSTVLPYLIISPSHEDEAFNSAPRGTLVHESPVDTEAKTAQFPTRDALVGLNSSQERPGAFYRDVCRWACARPGICSHSPPAALQGDRAMRDIDVARALIPALLLIAADMSAPKGCRCERLRDGDSARRANSMNRRLVQ